MKKMFKNLAIALATFVTIGAVAQSKNEIDTNRSYVEWEGKKITGSSHEGKLQFKSGSVTFDQKGTLTGGEFVVDMNSLMVTDLTGEYKTKLENHLKNDDFFGTETHPEATLVFTNVKLVKKSGVEADYRVTANLTIKGITQKITFNLEVDGNEIEADDIRIDRTKFGIKYSSGSFFKNLGDKAIRDNFEIDVQLYLL